MPLNVLLEMDMRTFQTVNEVAGEIQRERKKRG